MSGILLNFDMVNAKKGQRADIRFCVSLGVCLAVTIRAIRIAHGANALSPRSVTRWYRQFQAGNQSVDDLPRSGRPSVLTANILNNIQAAVTLNLNILMTALANQIGILHGSVHKAVTKTLRMKKRPARWVPHDLTLPQQAWRLQTARQILRTFRCDPQLHRRLVSGNKSWFFVYDPWSKRQSLQWTALGGC